MICEAIIYFNNDVFSSNVLKVNSLECVSISNQEFKVRPKILHINSNEPSFHPYCVKINKCSSSCSNINDLYAKLCVPDVVKNLNVRVFNLMSTTYERRHKIS